MELLTLGTPGLRDAGDLPPATPKNLAVLTYLAVAEPGGHVRRDTLLSLFWPELDQEHARNALNQVLYQLRRLLGDGAVVSHGKEEVGVDPDVVACDAVRFLECAEERDWEGALELYRGDFLAGFHLSGAPRFERWLHAERRRLRRRAVEVALEAAGEAEAAGELDPAIGWLRRARKIEPTNERVTRRLARCLDRAGDRAGAVRAYELLAARLDEELGLEPSPETRALVDTIRERRRPSGAASPRPVSGAPETGRAGGRGRAGEPGRPSAPDDASSRPPPSGPARRPLSLGSARSFSRAAVAGTAALVLGAVVAGLLFAWPGSGSDVRETGPSVAVLPFTDLGDDARASHFADGLAADLLDALARIEGLRVASRRSSFRFRDSRMDVQGIGDSLGVTAVLEGSVRRSGDRLKVSVQLVDAEAGYQLWADSFERPLRMDALFRMQEEIARSIAAALEVRLADDVSRDLERLPTDDLEAYSLFLLAREAAERRTPEGFREAAALYRRAVARDSTFAEAWAGLGLVHVTSVTTSTPLPGTPPEDALELARSAVERALALDDGLAEAHVGRGLLSRVEGQETAAELAFRRAVELQPSYPHARQALAFLLATHGRTAEALEQMRQARLLDPLSMQLTGGLGRFLYYEGRFREAIVWLRRSLEMGPYDRAQVFLPLALAAAGRYREARDALGGLDPARHPPQRVQWVRGLVAALSGGEDFRDILAAHEALALQGRPDTAQATTEVAWLHAAAGQIDSAFAWYDRFEAWNPVELLLLRADPLLEPLRRDPRYRSLVRRADPEFPEPVTDPDPADAP